MNFLAADPDNKAKGAMLKKMTDEREAKIRNSMTEEEYIAYRKAVYKKNIEKSKNIAKEKDR